MLGWASRKPQQAQFLRRGLAGKNVEYIQNGVSVLEVLIAGRDGLATSGEEEDWLQWPKNQTARGT